jgi:hypothetical protein
MPGTPARSFPSEMSLLLLRTIFLWKMVCYLSKQNIAQRESRKNKQK